MNQPTLNHVIKLSRGAVQLFRSDGHYVRTVCSGAASAVVQGREVHVTLPPGRVRIFGVDGTYKRTI
jgi:hypothetical protein